MYNKNEVDSLIYTHWTQFVSSRVAEVQRMSNGQAVKLVKIPSCLAKNLGLLEGTSWISNFIYNGPVETTDDVTVVLVLESCHIQRY